MKSLMLKIMLIFSVMVFMICSVFWGFSTFISSKNLLEVGEEGFLALRDSWSIAIRDMVEFEDYSLETIALGANLMDDSVPVEQKIDSLRPYLEVGKELGYLNFVLIQSDGTGYSTDGSILNVSSQDYFTVPMAGGHYLSDPFIAPSSVGSGSLIRVSSVPLLVNNSPVGVLALVRDGYFFSDFLIQLSENVTGAGVIFSLEDGATIGHLNRESVGSNFIELAKSNPILEDLASIPLALMRGETGITEYTSSVGLARIGFYAPIEGTPWGLMVYSDIRGVEARSKSFSYIMVFFSLLMLGVGSIVTFFLARNIATPIKYATEQIKHLADGDLSFENKLKNYEKQKHEIGIIARSLYALKESFSNIFQDILNGAQQVASGSNQINSASQSVSSVASEQAASTEEISSTVEEMASNIRQNADNASKTGNISKQAVEKAHIGKQAVNEALEAVRKIAAEISVIEGIASQTNLLALNAAIEAARAGEAGKGFAVVASEVRKLAEKSQIAATEINELSTKTITVAERADEVISSVIPEIEKTAGLVEEISFASREQDTGAQQINNAIIQMDVGVQQNASSSEELASMAEELSSQAMHLIETLSFFKFAQGEDEKNNESSVKLISSAKTTLL